MRNQLDNDVAVILITGDTRTQRNRLAQQSGYQVLHKPYNLRSCEQAFIRR